MVPSTRNFVKSPKFLEDCITFHKLTLFNCDAAEQQKAYMMGSLRKPNLMIIQNHMSHCETMNGYITLLPTLQDSTSMVTSIEKGNIVFNDATLAGIVLATTPVVEPVRDEPQDRSRIPKGYAPGSREHREGLH